MRRLFNQVLLLVLALAPAATAQIITTVAGNSVVAGFSGDGGPATSARLALPTGVAADAAGNLFITDQGNQRIRRVDAISGIITTVAGSGGVGGFSGDGGLATSALFNFPLGIAVDAMGNLFIADQFNNRIRKVDAITGLITTVAGNGTGGFSGDGGLATSANLRFASGVLVDATGDLYIADRNNQRIRKVDAISGIITTVAGNGAQGFGGDLGQAINARFSSPVDVALDQAGNLFICDQLNERIRRVDAITGIITTVAGTGTPGFNGDGGPATSARLAGPRSLAVGPAGNLFIADLSNNRIRKVGLTPALIEELIDDVKALGLKGMAGQAQLNAALDALSQDPPDIQGAIIAMQSFISFVHAQSGKKIPTQVADDLIAHAQVIIELLQGS